MAPDFLESVRCYLGEHDPQNLPAEAVRYRGRGAAQEAHEAIRPTEINLRPDSLKSSLSNDEYRLYELIWRRALASQCAPARLNKTTLTTRSGSVLWLAKGMTIRFRGYTLYWDNLESANELPRVQENQSLRLKQAGFQQKQTQPPPRYTEPKLVQKMEAAGIGRPSTYAVTVKTLKQRDYVETRGKGLHPTQLGMETDRLLMQLMPDLVQSQFTAQMEDALDEVAAGQRSWEQYLISWNRSYLVPALQRARTEIKQQFPLVQSGDQRVRDQSQAPQKSALPPPKKTKPATANDLKSGEASRTSQPGVRLDRLMFTCPVCAKPLEEYAYVKAGQTKTLLRCSDPGVRGDRQHKEAVYFNTKNGWWSHKFGELDTLPGGRNV